LALALLATAAGICTARGFGSIIRLGPEAFDWTVTYGSIPLVAAIVGWGTNAVAIWMTFNPLEFRGYCPSVQCYGMPLCGWQGIIPANVRRMANEAVAQLTTKLFDARDAVKRLDTERIMIELRPAFEAVVPKIVEQIALDYAPLTWGKLPESVKSEIVMTGIENSSQAIVGMMDETHNDITRAFDLQALLVDLLVKDKQLVNDIFVKVAGKEYEFIRVSGFYLGFIFGLVQMAVWATCRKWWVLCLAGFLVGDLTNFVALKIIFQPIVPWRFCGFTFHGLFLQRQPEVAFEYAKIFAENVFNARSLILGMINSPSSDALFSVLDENVKQGIDKLAKQVVGSRRVVNMIVGKGQFTSIKARVSELIRAESLFCLLHVTPYLDEALNVRETLESSIRNLSCREFADMLEPAFREGELKLIVIGGVLGAAVGLAQAVLQVPEQFGLS